MSELDPNAATTDVVRVPVTPQKGARWAIARGRGETSVVRYSPVSKVEHRRILPITLKQLVRLNAGEAPDRVAPRLSPEDWEWLRTGVLPSEQVRR